MIRKSRYTEEKYSVRDEGNLASFQAPEAVAGAKAFACKLVKERNAE